MLKTVLLLYSKDVCEACNLKDLHYSLIYVDQLHAALAAHVLLSAEEHTKAGR